MIKIRKSEERGHANHGWLKSHHTFSFAGYQDPEQMGFRSLRVMNEDRVQAGRGFGTHSHNDMEIVSYVLEGELEHKDSMGNGEVLRPGEFQRITAGTGIKHSEFNPSKESPTHFYQIWLLPERIDLEPGYEQKAFDASKRQNKMQLVASRDGSDGSITIFQDAKIYLIDLSGGIEVKHEIPHGRHSWVQMLRGTASLNGQALQAGDAAAISDELAIQLKSDQTAELMIFDLA